MPVDQTHQRTRQLRAHPPGPAVVDLNTCHLPRTWSTSSLSSSLSLSLAQPSNPAHISFMETHIILLPVTCFSLRRISASCVFTKRCAYKEPRWRRNLIQDLNITAHRSSLAHTNYRITTNFVRASWALAVPFPHIHPHTHLPASILPSSRS